MNGNGKKKRMLMFCPEKSSTYKVCCLYSVALQTTFIMEANKMNPDQIAPKEQSDLGPYCLP